MERKRALTKREFQILYNLSPDLKVLKTKQRIREFYDYFGGEVFLSFSGGIDSTVLADIIRHMESPYNDIELVFFDTHNEDPTVYAMVELYGATVVPAPKTPAEVVEEVGYPLFNKEVAHVMDAMKRGLAFTTSDTVSVNNRRIIDLINTRYKLFLDAPMKISDKCCNITKKKPSKEFSKRTGKKPILAILAVESYLRIQQYLYRGCNAFEGKIQSTPIAFWKQSDILWYIAQNDLKIADCYKPRIKSYPLLGYKTCELLGKQQTGCLYCGFGKGIEFAKKVLKSECPEYVKEHQKEFDELH